MHDISYRAALVPVRDDFAAAHTRFWKCLASPGAWWTGSERVAIAAEGRQARHCTLCQARKAALTPAAVAGQHDHLGALSDPAVDVIHRVVTDPGRLSRQWCDETMTAGLSAEQYVEILGTLVALVSIDSFCRGIGVPLHPLPRTAAWDALLLSSAWGGAGRGLGADDPRRECHGGRGRPIRRPGRGQRDSRDEPGTR